MSSVNKVILIGRLGKDPEVRYMPNGEAVANVTIATSDRWKDKNSGQMQERTEWHNLVFYRRQAEVAGEYLRKGSQIYVEGRLQTRKWQTKEGQDRYTTEVIVNEMTMLGGKDGCGSENNQSAQTTQEYKPSEPAYSQPANHGRQAGGGAAGGFDSQDIPF